MSPHEHQKRHEEIFEVLNEAIADFLYHNPGTAPDRATIADLYAWSFREKSAPTENGGWAAHIYAVCGHCGNRIDMSGPHAGPHVCEQKETPVIITPPPLLKISPESRRR